MIDYERFALLMPDAGGLFWADGFYVQPARQFNVMFNVSLNESRHSNGDGHG